MTPLASRLDAYERLLRLDKPIGTLLLLWPTLWGVWLASGGRPPWQILWIFVIGTVLMRSAGCALNDWADRTFFVPLTPAPATRFHPLFATSNLLLCALRDPSG